MTENQQAFIQIREISKHFGDVIAVNKVDLDIKTVSYTHLTLPTICSV